MTLPTPRVRAGIEAAPSAYPAAPHRMVSAAKVLAITSSVGRYAVSAPSGLASAQASRARMVKVGMQADPRRSGIRQGPVVAPAALLHHGYPSRPVACSMSCRPAISTASPASWCSWPASGLRGHAKAVAGEGLAQRRPVVPSSAAAAVMLPSRSARARARSALARSVRKRLGCQPARGLSSPSPSPARSPRRRTRRQSAGPARCSPVP